MKFFLHILKIFLIFATWIGGSSYPSTRGKPITPSTSLMIGDIKSVGNMGKIIPRFEVINRLIAKNGNLYDYSLVTDENYRGTHFKIPIKCNKCDNIFYQTPRDNIQGHGCPFCAGSKKLTTYDFISRAIEVWGDNRFDYSNVNYKNNSTKVQIKCNQCGNTFYQSPYSHLAKHDCPFCSNRALLTNEEFKKRAIKNHGDNKFCYDLVDYKGAKVPIKIICNCCGNVFEQMPNVHLNGHGCPQCNIKQRNESLKLPLNTWVQRCKQNHVDEYDYSRVSFANLFEKVCIGCSIHGWFWQDAKAHMDGACCPECARISKGEERIAKYLNINSIGYVAQYRVPNESILCKNKTLIIDFYVPSKNIAIEYNGAQHYRPTKFWGGTKKLEEQQERDWAVRKYCKDHKIRLIEIPYNEYNKIEDILSNELK